MTKTKTSPPAVNGRLEVTSAAAWKQARAEGRLVRLRSGNVARIRTIGMDYIVKSGKLPDALVGMAAETLLLDSGSNPPAITMEDLEKHVDFYNMLMEMAFIVPQVTSRDVVPDDAIHVNDIDLWDKLWVSQEVLFKTLNELADFRARQAPDVEPVLSSEGDGNTSE